MAASHKEIFHESGDPHTHTFGSRKQRATEADYRRACEQSASAKMARDYDRFSFWAAEKKRIAHEIAEAPE